MSDWEEFRLFGTLARMRTLRAAAAAEGISHSTLSRRMEALEARVGTRLFLRGPRGFTLTDEGETLRDAIATAADTFDAGLREVAGSDREMRGTIRVTLPDFIAYYGLLPPIAAFQEAYPQVRIEVDISYDTANLSRRDADVAVRLTALGKSPEETLIGRKVGQSRASGYASRAYLDRYDLSDPDCGAAWLGWAPDQPQDWILQTPYPQFPARGSFNHAELQHHAARAGMGLSYLPFCIGEADDMLVRLPGMEPRPARDIWVLTHADLRNTKRLRLFRDWFGDAVRAADL